MMNECTTKAVRLDRFLSNAGCGTRSEVKRLLKEGRIQVNEVAEHKPERKVRPFTDQVFLDGRKIEPKGYTYYLLNKPAGYVTATEDRLHPPVLDLLKEKGKGLAPVGRLDLDTEGLLLITDDGPLAHMLLSPARHVDKTYEVILTGPVTKEDVELFRQGLDIQEKHRTRPAILEPMKELRPWPACVKKQKEEPVYCAKVTLQEGKYHQVKRMFHAVGKEVVYLRRRSFGPLILEESLKTGCFRPLTQQEKLMLLAAAGRETWPGSTTGIYDQEARPRIVKEDRSMADETE